MNRLSIGVFSLLEMITMERMETCTERIFILPKQFSIAIVLFLLSSLVVAQESKVAITARAQKDEILLRWAPTKAVIWHYANTYGYTLERYTILKDSALVKPVQKLILGTFRPLPLGDWEPVIDQNEYAAVAAQAIYGETFELTQNYASDVVQVINKTKELEQRFSFALFAADQSFKVANLQGLAFIDTAAKPNEKYLYKVYANIPPAIDKVDSGTVYVGISDFAPLPKPIDVSAQFGDGMVMIKWNREFFERVYSSFIIEKSEDNGKTYQPISQEPIVNAFSGENPHSKYYFKMDSIVNKRKYIYRIKGITAFGKIGPPSDLMKGEGSKLIAAKAQIRIHKVGINNVQITWQFDKTSEPLIDGFIIQRASHTQGPFNTLKIEKNTTVRNFTDRAPLSTNYYKVGLVVNNNESNYSFPYMVQLEDSIPPAIPVGITAKADTMGAVILTWQPNIEPDLMGYRVYRSNFRSSEFAQITSSPISTPQWVDSINLKTLTNKIFYVITAVDFRNNTSAFSSVIEVEKPDVVPPVPPVFKSVHSNEQGIYLQWVNSSSIDVATHLIYRRKQGDTNWYLLAKISNLDSVSFTDSNIEPMQHYQYTLVATDKAGLESEPAVPVTATKIYWQSVKFERFNYVVNREQKQIELSWQLDLPVKGILIYRAISDAPLTLLKKVEGGIESFSDVGVQINTSYTYRIKSVLPDGRFGEWSDEVKVHY